MKMQAYVALQILCNLWIESEMKLIWKSQDMKAACLHIYMETERHKRNFTVICPFVHWDKNSRKKKLFFQNYMTNIVKMHEIH